MKDIYQNLTPNVSGNLFKKKKKVATIKKIENMFFYSRNLGKNFFFLIESYRSLIALKLNF